MLKKLVLVVKKTAYKLKGRPRAMQDDFIVTQKNI